MPAPAGKRGSARTKARKRALDVLFEADLRQASNLEVLSAQTELGEPPVRPFTTELVEGVERHARQIDTLIAENLTGGWTLDRMPRVDRNLARIAVYEIVYTEVADEVAAAECAALAQELSTDDSAAFLNGLLRTIAGRRAAGTI